jgi:RNA polymerase sigma factor (sigma-70 family)
MARRTDTAGDVALVRACAEGDAAARRTFQDRFAEDIYNFPVKIYRVPADRAADFYVYVFERDRIFQRVRTFEGRNGAQLRTFLAYHVLKSLFLEWQRTSRDLDTVSLDETPNEGAAGDVGADAASGEAEPVAPPPALWAALVPEERLDLKLLSLLECDLGPDDLRLLARLSRRSLRDTTALVAEVQEGLRRHDARLARLGAALDSAWGWIVLRRRELQETAEKMRLLETEHETQARSRLEARRRQLDAAVAMRTRQRDRLLDEIRTFKVTTPYKDIARLLNAPVGTVCSRIFRLRQRLEQGRDPKEARP